MPCTQDFGSGPPPRRSQEDQDTIDKLTRYLCAVIRMMEPDQMNSFLVSAAKAADGVQPKEIWRWWLDHKRADRLKELIAARSKALAELDAATEKLRDIDVLIDNEGTSL
jgi:hypothetical protein